jgi:curli biogenesis system outer membrane secretion channel CsgG
MNTTHDCTNRRGVATFAIGTLALALAACTSTDPKLGGSPSVATGAAGGATASNANSQLEHCDKTMGTLAVVEDQAAPWYTYYYSHYRNLGSTVPVLRMMIQQSNCFVIVERGRAMNNMMQERALSQSGEMRDGSNFGKGQMAAADYTMSPTINFNQQGGSGGSVGAAGLARGLGGVGAVFAAGAGSMKSNEAATTLIMIDNRSGVQLAAAEGSAKNFDFGFFGSAFTAGLGGGASGYSNTPEGKIIVAAFADSYNQLVKAVKNYRAQTVAGGLGAGGTLGVQGGSTPASQAVDPPKPAAAAAPAKKAPAKKAPTTPPSQ